MGFRNEYKYIIDFKDYILIKNRLNSVMEKDIHSNESGEYKVRSLYFDNIYDKALKEKIDGVSIREKFRIRCYNLDFSYIILEKKYKVSRLCEKTQVKITEEECRKLIECRDLDWILQDERGLLKELYFKIRTQMLRPKILIDYMREAYEYNGVRITLDRDIKSHLNNIYLFDKESSGVKLRDDIILEIKSKDKIPTFIKDMIGLDNNMVCSYSKYERCRI